MGHLGDWGRFSHTGKEGLHLTRSLLRLVQQLDEVNVLWPLLGSLIESRLPLVVVLQQARALSQKLRLVSP